MSKFQTRVIDFKESQGAEIFDNSNGYKLLFLVGKRERVSFKMGLRIPLNCSVLDADSPRVLVTGRDYARYNPALRVAFMNDWANNRGRQYVEVCSGLGGFLTCASLYALEVGAPRPIAIDMADYRALRDILTEARDADIQFTGENPRTEELVKKKFNRLIGRCDIALDPAKVRLFSMKLGEAIAGFDFLHEIADVVVDNYGMGLYGDRTENGWQGLRRRLLKPSGVIYTDEGRIAA